MRVVQLRKSPHLLVGSPETMFISTESTPVINSEGQIQ